MLDPGLILFGFLILDIGAAAQVAREKTAITDMKRALTSGETTCRLFSHRL